MNVETCKRKSLFIYTVQDIKVPSPWSRSLTKLKIAWRKDWDTQMIFISVYSDDTAEKNNIWCVTKKEKNCNGFLIQKVLCYVRICSEQKKTSKRRRNAYHQEAGSFHIECVDYCSVILTVALVQIHPLSCEFGIIWLLKVILNNMQDLNAHF